MESIFLLLIVYSNCARAQFLFPSTGSENLNFEGSKDCTCDLIIYDGDDPVCGNNRVTYANPSHLYCDKKCKYPDLAILKRGSCGNSNAQHSVNFFRRKGQSEYRILNRCSCPTTSNYNPVCGSNGITYENPSLLQCERQCKQPELKIARYGLCREEEYFSDLPFLSDALGKCDCSIDNENDPVCGTDGYSYPNPSALTCVTSCSNPSLGIVHYGSCKEQQKPHNFGSVRCRCSSSSEYYRPVCADNGITYDNLSLFHCAQRCLNRDLKIVSELPCRDQIDVDERANGSSKH